MPSIQGATRGLPSNRNRIAPNVGRRRCKVRHAAVDALARELGLEAPLRVRRSKLTTCRGIHWAKVYVWGEVAEHLITLDSYPAAPLAFAHSLGHELMHALDCERILRESEDADGRRRGHAWAEWCERNANATRAAGGHYEDQEHEQRADIAGALLSYRILRDCLVVA